VHDEPALKSGVEKTMSVNVPSTPDTVRVSTMRSITRVISRR
jgi:hypothetical protein